MLWQLFHLILIIVVMVSSLSVALIKGQVVQGSEVQVEVRSVLLLGLLSLTAATILVGATTTSSSCRSGSRSRRGRIVRPWSCLRGRRGRSYAAEGRSPLQVSEGIHVLVCHCWASKGKGREEQGGMEVVLSSKRVKVKLEVRRCSGVGWADGAARATQGGRTKLAVP